MKILLTGAGGFIGRALLPVLLENDHQVTLISRKPSVCEAEELITDAAGWAEAVRGKPFDACIHLAWISTPGLYLESPENEQLADATISLASALFRQGLKHFIGLGSCIEYSPDLTVPCAEYQTPIDPRSPYGIAKNRARKGVSSAAETYQAGYTWVRLFYPYGVGEHPNRIPSAFLRILQKKQQLPLKTPNSIKDWIEIRDVVSAILHLVERGTPEQEINLGTGVGTRICDLARIAAKIVGADCSLIQTVAPPTDDPYSFHVADTYRLHSTGWKSAISLQDGLRNLHTNYLTN